MTDLEMTRLCGKAMGYEIVQRSARRSHGWWCVELAKHYDPFQYDEQALALIKTFQLLIELNQNEAGHHIRRAGSGTVVELKGNFHAALNRAIVECVAKMQGEPK